MKKIMTAAMLCISMAAFSQGNYTIDGKVSGEADGYKVYLLLADYTRQEAIDTTVIENGRFRFEGSVERPALHQLIIDKTPPGEESSQRHWTSSRFYLENSAIRFEAAIDSLTMYYHRPGLKPALIVGSRTEDENKVFQSLLAESRQELSRLNNLYNEQYHRPALEGVFNTEEGIRIVREMIPLEQEIKDRTMDYIRQNPSSVIAFDQAMYNFLGMFVEMTAVQIDELTAVVRKGWEGTARFDQYLQYAEKAKRTALNTTYQDFELMTPAGEKVTLSSLVPRGQYCMLEFWASWCGPCRGEIPHLVEIDKKYQDAGFKIISISIDEREGDWKKAMEEEGMTWTQLNDPDGFQGAITQAYNILGIPFAILVDPDGRIVDFNMRGARLDNALLEIYGF